MPTQPNQQPITIVLVDDHAVFQTALARHLAAHTRLTLVAVAASAGEALQLPESLTPDVVLLDVRLPDQSGLPLISPLLAKWPQSKLIVLTFEDYPSLRQAALAAGATDFISKLYAAEQLVPAIYRALHDSHGGLSA